MQTAVAAYRLLVAIAALDGGLGEAEERLLARYRRALDLPEDVHAAAPTEAHQDEALGVLRAASYQERAHLLVMLVRVAYADGRLHRLERRRLKRFAEAVGISRLEFGGVLVAAEHELHRMPTRARRLIWSGASLLAAVLLAVALGRALDVAPPAGVDAGTSDVATFRAIEERARAALLLLQVDYELRRGEERSMRRSTGTGFFLTPEGLIATNKHVLEPWKFGGEPARLVATGYRVVPESVRVVAYPVGVPVADADGRRTTAGAFDTREGTLEVVGTALDRMELRQLRLPSGDTVEHALHANDSADLALLRARSTEPVVALALRDDSQVVQTLEPVLVLGFPDGTGLLERGLAHPTAARGEVGKVEEMLLIQAPLLGGSSGGPVLDTEGRVVGVATRTMVGADLGRCIQARDLLALWRLEGGGIDRR